MSGTRKVFVAIPAYDGTVRVPTMLSLIGAIGEGAQDGIDFYVRGWMGSSILPNVRNGLVAEFMQSDCTDLLFVDSDVWWGLGTVRQILSHPVDFVGGTYRFKRDDEEYMVSWIGDHNDPRENGLVKVNGLPGGFFRMTRAGLERVIAKVPHYAYDIPGQEGLKGWWLFDNHLRSGKLVGEDYVFCDLVRACGETVWLDPALYLTHNGAKDYAGDLPRWIAETNREKLPEEVRRERDANLMKFAESFATPEMDRLLRVAIGKAA